MKKPYKFTERWDDYLCYDCLKPVKANVISRKLNPPVRCYKCHVKFEHDRGHIMKGAINEGKDSTAQA